MKGSLVLCKEEMDIVRVLPSGELENLYFKQGTYYTALLSGYCGVIDRSHKAIVLPESTFVRHFEIKQLN